MIPSSPVPLLLLPPVSFPLPRPTLYFGRARDAPETNVQVINALVSLRSCSSSSKPSSSPAITHVPFRESKLTRLLADSLGGNTKTAMIANLGPGESSAPETLSTLSFACVARRIENRPRVNEDPRDSKLREYQEEIAKLRAMAAEAAARAGGGVMAQPPPLPSPSPSSSLFLAQKEALERERASILQQLDSLRSERAAAARSESLARLQIESLAERLREAEEARNGSGAAQEEREAEVESLREKAEASEKAAAEAAAVAKRESAAREALEAKLSERLAALEEAERGAAGGVAAAVEAQRRAMAEAEAAEAAREREARRRAEVRRLTSPCVSFPTVYVAPSFPDNPFSFSFIPRFSA